MTALAITHNDGVGVDTPEAGRVALTFFFNLMTHWGCSVEQQRTLLAP